MPVSTMMPGRRRGSSVGVAIGAHDADEALKNRDDVRYLDYTPLTVRRPVDLDVMLRVKAANVKCRVAICVTMYSEEGDELRRTLEAVAQNLDGLASAGVSWEQVVTCVIVDGEKKASASALEYAARRLKVFDASLLRPEVSGLRTQMHLFERTARLLQHASSRAYHRPMQLVFALKAKNGGKLNSHLWFFSGFCRQLKPTYCVLVDVGTEPRPMAISLLFSTMENNSQVGGCCGQIAVRDMQVWNPLEAAQFFEYVMAHDLDKAMESVYGFISVLPGAFSAYRWVAIRGEPLNHYFMIEEHQMAELGPFIANMYLAEDRVLSFEVAFRAQLDWTLTYVSGAIADTDAPSTLVELIKQRRRWLNGAFFSLLYYLLNFQGALWESGHGVFRKCFLSVQFFYLAINLVVNWFGVGSLYLTLTLVFESGLSDFVVTAPFVLFGIKTSYVFLTVLQVLVGLNTKPHRAAMVHTFCAVGYGIIMAMSMFLGVWLIANGRFDSDVVFIGMIAIAAYAIAALIHGDLFQIVVTLPQYMFMLPTFVNMFTIYSFANMHDISWGTKEGSVANTLLIDEMKELAAALDKDSGLGGLSHSAKLTRVATARVGGTGDGAPSDDTARKFKAAMDKLREVRETEAAIEEKTAQKLAEEKEEMQHQFNAFRTRMMMAWMASQWLLVTAITNWELEGGFMWVVASGVTFLSVFRLLGSVYYQLERALKALFRCCGVRNACRVCVSRARWLRRQEEVVANVFANDAAHLEGGAKIAVYGQGVAGGAHVSRRPDGKFKARQRQRPRKRRGSIGSRLSQLGRSPSKLERLNEEREERWYEDSDLKALDRKRPAALRLDDHGPKKSVLDSMGHIIAPYDGKAAAHYVRNTKWGGSTKILATLDEDDQEAGGDTIDFGTRGGGPARAGAGAGAGFGAGESKRSVHDAGAPPVLATESFLSRQRAANAAQNDGAGAGDDADGKGHDRRFWATDDVLDLDETIPLSKTTGATNKTVAARSSEGSNGSGGGGGGGVNDVLRSPAPGRRSQLAPLPGAMPSPAASGAAGAAGKGPLPSVAGASDGIASGDLRSRDPLRKKVLGSPEPSSLTRDDTSRSVTTRREVLDTPENRGTPQVGRAGGGGLDITGATPVMDATDASAFGSGTARAGAGAAASGGDAEPRHGSGVAGHGMDRSADAAMAFLQAGKADRAGLGPRLSQENLLRKASAYFSQDVIKHPAGAEAMLIDKAISVACDGDDGASRIDEGAEEGSDGHSTDTASTGSHPSGDDHDDDHHHDHHRRPRHRLRRRLSEGDRRPGTAPTLAHADTDMQLLAALGGGGGDMYGVAVKAVEQAAQHKATEHEAKMEALREEHARIDRAHAARKAAVEAERRMQEDIARAHADVMVAEKAHEAAEAELTELRRAVHESAKRGQTLVGARAAGAGGAASDSFAAAVGGVGPHTPATPAGRAHADREIAHAREHVDETKATVAAAKERLEALRRDEEERRSSEMAAWEADMRDAIAHEGKIRTLERERQHAARRSVAAERVATVHVAAKQAQSRLRKAKRAHKAAVEAKAVPGHVNHLAEQVAAADAGAQLAKKELAHAREELVNLDAAYDKQLEEDKAKAEAELEGRIASGGVDGFGADAVVRSPVAATGADGGVSPAGLSPVAAAYASSPYGASPLKPGEAQKAAAVRTRHAEAERDVERVTALVSRVEAELARAKETGGGDSAGGGGGGSAGDAVGVGEGGEAAVDIGAVEWRLQRSREDMRMAQMRLEEARAAVEDLQTSEADADRALEAEEQTRKRQIEEEIEKIQSEFTANQALLAERREVEKRRQAVATARRLKAKRRARARAKLRASFSGAVATAGATSGAGGGDGGGGGDAPTS